MKKFKLKPFRDKQNKPFLNRCHHFVFMRDGTAYGRRRRCDGCIPCKDSPPRFLECTRGHRCGIWWKTEPEEDKPTTKIIEDGTELLVSFLLPF